MKFLSWDQHIPTFLMETHYSYESFRNTNSSGRLCYKLLSLYVIFEHIRI